MRKVAGFPHVGSHGFCNARFFASMVLTISLPHVINARSQLPFGFTLMERSGKEIGVRYWLVSHRRSLLTRLQAFNMRTGVEAEASVASICTMLTLPTVMLKELMSIVTAQMAADRRREPRVSLYLAMPPTITAPHLPPVRHQAILHSGKILCFVVCQLAIGHFDSCRYCVANGNR
jgi:hypothetical protein